MSEKQRHESPAPEQCCETNECWEIDRCMFVKLGGATLAASGAGSGPLAAAGPFSADDTVDHFVPVDKKLREEWFKELSAGGKSTWYEKR